MNDKQLIQQSISEADAATSSGVTVRTDGGDDEVEGDLPLIVLEWNSNRATDDEGHSNFYKKAKNASGEEIGKILQMKFNMEIDFTVKAASESKRDEIADTLQRHFILYEGNTDALHSDTYVVEVGDISPRKLHMMEPDWYQNGLIINIGYKKFVTDDSLEPITSVDETIDVQEDL